jgi:predicted flap endonuclease-1-like 5' DNA nuclease
MTNVQLPMNEAQIELLKLFASGLQEHQMKALKQMLISFQFRLLEEEVEKAAKEKNITDADVEKALDEHWRTPYIRKPQANLLIVLDENSIITSALPQQNSASLPISNDAVTLTNNNVLSEKMFEQRAFSLAKDDLKIIEGIDPKIEALLYENGILTFAQLSYMKLSSLKEILKNGGLRYKIHEPTYWAEQAALAAAGKWEELKIFQNNLNNKSIL